MNKPSDFSAEVQAAIGPLLTQLGFTLDEIDDSPDEGGRERHIVYYRSNDCKIQIYKSRREGKVNGMIAAANASNGFGLRTKHWQDLTTFSERPNGPVAELLKAARAEYNSYANPVEWVRDRIAKYYNDAHRGILAKYADGQ
jgi:hypothetical protein